jgi:hypothetical protein
MGIFTTVTTPLTYADAIALLKYVNSFEDLANLIARLDAQGTGTQTFLYSGGFGANFNARGLANALANV